MIPRRLYDHIRRHDWFAVAIDFLIVVIGVFVGVQVVETLREDLRNSVTVESGFVARIGSANCGSSTLRLNAPAGAFSGLWKTRIPAP